MKNIFKKIKLMLNISDKADVATLEARISSLETSLAELSSYVSQQTSIINQLASIQSDIIYSESSSKDSKEKETFFKLDLRSVMVPPDDDNWN